MKNKTKGATMIAIGLVLMLYAVGGFEAIRALAILAAVGLIVSIYFGYATWLVFKKDV